MGKRKSRKATTEFLILPSHTDEDWDDESLYLVLTDWRAEVPRLRQAIYRFCQQFQADRRLMYLRYAMPSLWVAAHSALAPLLGPDAEQILEDVPNGLTVRVRATLPSRCQTDDDYLWMSRANNQLYCGLASTVVVDKYTTADCECWGEAPTGFFDLLALPDDVATLTRSD